MELKLKVLKGLSTELCRERELRYKYETNRAFKAAALFTYLRNQTSSDTIWLSHFKHAADKYASDMGISRASFYNYISYAQDLGLVEYRSGRIQFTSYTKICKKYLLDTQLITISHDPANCSLEYTLKALEYEEARERMTMGLNSKVRNNPTVKAAFAVEASNLGVQEEVIFNPGDLFKLQQYAFAAGGSETTYETLFIANPDLNRNLFTIARARKMKSYISAQYERKRLEKLKLIIITERPMVQCPYKLAPEKGKIKGKSPKRRRCYDTEHKVAFWQLPHSITLNPSILFQEVEKPRPQHVV